MINRRDFIKALAGVMIFPIPASEDGYFTFQIRQQGLRKAEIRNIPAVERWSMEGLTIGKDVEPAVVIVQFTIDPNEFQHVIDQFESKPHSDGLKAV